MAVSELLIHTSGQGGATVPGAISYQKEQKMPEPQSGRARAQPATGGRMGTIPFEPLVIENIEDAVVAAVLKSVREAVGRPVSGRALQRWPTCRDGALSSGFARRWVVVRCRPFGG